MDPPLQTLTHFCLRDEPADYKDQLCGLSRSTSPYTRYSRAPQSTPHRRGGVEYLVYGEGLDVDKVGGAGGLHQGPGLVLRGLTASLCFGLLKGFHLIENIEFT